MTRPLVRSLTLFLAAVPTCALLALGWTGAALAEVPTAPTEAADVDFTGVTDFKLDLAFEEFVERRRPKNDGSKGPSRMACKPVPGKAGAETCTVTPGEESPVGASPAAPGRP